MQICAKEKTNSFPTDHATFTIMTTYSRFDDLNQQVDYSLNHISFVLIHEKNFNEKSKEGSKRCKYGHKLTFESPSWWRLLKN